MALDGSLLLQYRARISRGMFLATGSYLVLPLLAISIQIVHYGLALVDLAICVAMVLMFLVSIKEQNEEMLRLETSRAHLAEKLDIATVLNRCVEKLSGGGHDLDKATHDLLGVINDYFCADRSYVYELDAAHGIAVNTHEFVRDGVSAEKDNLQKVPVEIIASCWRPLNGTGSISWRMSAGKRHGAVCDDAAAECTAPAGGATAAGNAHHRFSGRR